MGDRRPYRDPELTIRFSGRRKKRAAAELKR
jgi:hypothetical protein